ncbi:hypothetical protein X798_06090, partial [Onchocerca flexuosa]
FYRCGKLNIIVTKHSRLLDEKLFETLSVAAAIYDYIRKSSLENLPRTWGYHWKLNFPGDVISEKISSLMVMYVS